MSASADDAMERIQALFGLESELGSVASIDKAFRLYEKHVIPPEAGPAQRKESRRVFYAAVDWFFKRVMKASDDEEAAMGLLSRMSEEIAAFQKDVLRGKA